MRVSHEWSYAGSDIVHMLDFGGASGQRPALFLHGVGGSAWTWEPVAEQLNGVVRMVAADLPGYGESRWRDEFSYSSRSLARTMVQVSDRYLPGEIDVVGFSWGGLIGLAMTAMTPFVRRIVVVDIPPATPLTDTDIPQLRTSFPDLAAAVAASRALAPRATDSVLWRDALHAMRPTPGGTFEKKIDPRLAQRWPFRNDDLWPELTAFDAPMLVVRAEHSPTLPPDVAQRMVAEARRAELRSIADCGHLIPLERPAELAAAIRDFLLC